MRSKSFEAVPDQIFFLQPYHHCRQLQERPVRAPLRLPVMAFIFLDEIWWVLGTVVFLLSRHGRWPKHFILRLPRCIVVKACLNCRAGIEIKEMLKENTSVLWP